MIRAAHRRLRNTLDIVEQRSGSAIAAWLATEMRQRENHWQLALAEFSNGNEDAILDTWLQYVPDESLLERLDDVIATSETSVDHLMAMVNEFHETLGQLYGSLAAGTSAPRLQTFFSRLEELEKTITAEQSWSARDV